MPPTRKPPPAKAAEMKVGILSDTHGLLRPAVETLFAGCDRILHAGDVGGEEILHSLEQIAPVVAVCGNMDYGAWSKALPSWEMIDIGGVVFYILHDQLHLDLDPAAAGVDLVVSGHTHRPALNRQGGVTYLNPGSAGHRRYNYPISVAVVRITGGVAHPRIIELDD